MERKTNITRPTFTTIVVVMATTIIIVTTMTSSLERKEILLLKGETGDGVRGSDLTQSVSI